jgi:6-phosphogluconolactonase
MKNISKNWLIKETAQEVAESTKSIILKSATKAIKERKLFKIVLAGGTTPKLVYSLLAKEECDWDKWYFYLSDERCLAPDDPERNSQMIDDCLLSKIIIPQDNIKFIPTELGVVESTEMYEAVIAEATPFDMVLLGMGEDGHTASLFPGHKHDGEEFVHQVTNAPKAPSERVSLSTKALSANRQLLILVTGSSKQDAIKQWVLGVKLPITQIKSLGKVTVLVDKKSC